MKTFKKILTVFLFAILAAICGLFTLYFVITSDTKLQEEKFQPAAQSATVLDANGEPFAQIGFTSGKRCTKFADIPQYVKNAFIGAEDKNFYTHNGLDYSGMMRAAWKNIRAGSFKQGASTISQQLIKNTQLSAEKTIRRKMKEIKLTRQLEKRYSKDEIFEMYLNTIYFGHTCYGITDASDFYFDTSPEHLSIAQGATLAAVIRSPNRYSPFVNPKKCKSVRDGILSRMETLKKITPNERAKAEAEPLPMKKQKTQSGSCYTDAVQNELQSLPLGALYRMQGGLRIYTHCNANLQKHIESFSTSADRSGKSILVADNAQHGICAYVSTVGTIRRQPGSAIKPLAVYAPAIEENLIAPCTPVLDEPTSFGAYSPSDYHGQYRGWTSARDALAYSMNIPAVRFLNQLGIEKSEQYLNRMGLVLQETDKNLALALGGLTEGFTLRELVGAYSVFAENGVFVPLSCIQKIESDDGTVLYTQSPIPTRVFSPDTVSLLNDMTRKTVTHGTAKKLRNLPFDIHAKTGTAGTQSGNTDAWTLAYTSAHTVGVWMGNADNRTTDISGGGLPCHYAAEIFKSIYANRPPRAMERDANVVECVLDAESYQNNHSLRLAAPQQPRELTFSELFRKCNQPTETSPIYDTPTCTAKIEYTDGSVRIYPSNTQNYSFIIRRQERGHFKKIYDGSIADCYTDKTVKSGKIYHYTVQPYYLGTDGKRVFGREIKLPSVLIGTEIPNIFNR